nr:spore germination protein [Tuberibacillus sp. Marseille-P3662]
MFRSFFRRSNPKIMENAHSYTKKQQTPSFEVTIYKDLQKNINNIQSMMDNPSDLIVKKASLGGYDRDCAIIYIDGLVKTDYISQRLIKSIHSFNKYVDDNISKDDGEAIINALQYDALPASEVDRVRTLDDVTLPLLSGNTAIFIDGLDQVIMVDTKGWKSRSIEPPVTEAVVRGPRVGFIENIRTNTSMIRRSIRDPNLRMKSIKVGRRSKADVTITYLDGVVNPALVKETVRRLKSIDLDDVESSGDIEQWIEDSFLSPFPQVQHTERPDRVRAALVQGRVGILTDNSPFALIVPVTFGQLFHSAEDYYERWLLASFIRMLRYIAAFFSVFLPGLYVALVAYHPGMIPTKLAFSIAATREGVPFPSLIEALIMEGIMELLREAGLRLPQPIGQTIGIVGGLVIGEAAVTAGIVSPIMVIIVALTAISSFSLPSYSLAISLRLLRFAIMFAAAIFGLYGLVLIYIMINVHFTNMKSFGIPYATPFAPQLYSDFKDLVVRVPLTMMSRRPKMTQTGDQDRSNRKRGRR